MKGAPLDPTLNQSVPSGPCGQRLGTLPSGPAQDQQELIGRQAPGCRGPQTKRAKPSWLEAGILRAHMLLPKGLRYGSPPPESMA